jgi:hypothetical protein
MSQTDAIRSAGLEVCDKGHGHATNGAVVYGHPGSLRTCIKAKGNADIWVYDPGWEVECTATYERGPAQPLLMCTKPKHHQIGDDGDHEAMAPDGVVHTWTEWHGYEEDREEERSGLGTEASTGAHGEERRA